MLSKVISYDNIINIDSISMIGFMKISFITYYGKNHLHFPRTNLFLLARMIFQEHIPIFFFFLFRIAQTS